MRFVGGLIRGGSFFFRYQPHTIAVMDLTEAEVSIRVGGKFNIFDEPIRWAPPDLEYNVQRGRVNSYVGLRGRGESEWTWFHTRTLDQVSASLGAIGASKVDAPPLRLTDIFPITFPGSALVVGVGLAVLALGLGVQWGFPPSDEGHSVGAGLRLLGWITVAVGLISVSIHLWGRRPRQR